MYSTAGSEATSHRLTTTARTPAWRKARAKLETPSPSITSPRPVTQADNTASSAFSFNPNTSLMVRNPLSPGWLST